MLGKVNKLREWLQSYANEHNVYIGIKELYSPTLFASKMPMSLRYDEEDGNHYWTCQKSCRKCKYLPLHCCEWLDDKVPENLHNAIYDLDDNGGYRKLIVPNREKH